MADRYPTVRLVIEAEDHPEHGWTAKVTSPDFPEDWFMPRNHWVLEENLVRAIYQISRKYWPGHFYQVASCTVKDNDDGGSIARMLQAQFDTFKQLNNFPNDTCPTTTSGLMRNTPGLIQNTSDQPHTATERTVVRESLPLLAQSRRVVDYTSIDVYPDDQKRKLDFFDIRESFYNSLTIQQDVKFHDQVVGKFIRSFIDETNRLMVECDMDVDYGYIFLDKNAETNMWYLEVTKEKPMEDSDSDDD
jgi:hypothetical protein